MLPRKLNEDCELKLSVPDFAEELFKLTDENRAYLRRWLPWLDNITEPAHSRAFIQSQQKAFKKGKSLTICIFYKGKIAGVIGFNEIDPSRKTGQIGYWLGEKFTGKGIMTMAVEALIEIGQDHFDLECFEIRCATGNSQSRAIPERLGFKHQCTIERAERVYDQCFDHEVYVKRLTAE
ncbi:MAG: GNAT family protein [Verrucomicrobiota bacterium]